MPQIKAETYLVPSTYNRYRSFCVHVGSYTDTFGIRIVREDVARFISSRDDYTADPEDIFITSGGNCGIKVNHI